MGGSIDFDPQAFGELMALAAERSQTPPDLPRRYSFSPYHPDRIRGQLTLRLAWLVIGTIAVPKCRMYNAARPEYSST